MKYLTSRGIRKIRFLDQFLDHIETDEHFKLTKEHLILGWGRKKSFFKAKAYAKKHHLHLLCLEDGFIRSLGLGKDGYTPLSLILDETGIYFDALQPSDLENLILLAENSELNQRAEQNIQTILKNGITKYNQKFIPLDPQKFTPTQQHILVVDQTYGDQSIQYAGANVLTFKKMLAQAQHDFPDAIIWVKVHPDVLAKKSKGHFTHKELNHPQIRVLTQQYNPIELLRQFTHVYVVSSQLGFEALMCGKQVYCFGMPWYAGWGLTDDRYAPVYLVNERRNKQRSLLHLFACAYLKYARYVHPVTQQQCELEDLLSLFIPNIRAQKYIPIKLSAYGFSHWKRQFISDFLNFPDTQINYYSLFKPPKTDIVLAWGKKAQRLRASGYQYVITVEDGFIRSIGLGANLVRPCSLVFDDIGIYYDATRPSRLENLLKYRAELSLEEKQRVLELTQMLIELHITKYNVGIQQELVRPQGYDNVILVIGQVEDDMSIQLGSIEIKTNLSLLKTVKARNPTAYIIYKPHPDVVEGLRVGAISEHIAYQYCHHIETKVSILECFKICDDVHTISSLSGFEALIRGLNVYCYGLPFYAGWGLTYDEYQCERRGTLISLEKLIFCTLVEYPLYNFKEINILPTIHPENVIEHLSKMGYFQHPKSYLMKAIGFFRNFKS
ncbi:beta-3-deoxy-D-manno-oct-2-ulosonic acid transferase [Acinetobacter sp. ANC 4558]|uniref:capsular polysaccharide biosynthesis protein n=1 Tax=Acinetobacter sp. ANC 4558 TaxID=1977876 RepID=UPI000A345337|nr:capsular polysaccharide biosynthesis protein [Acinetobacter sp. ANC 4558]OTG86724.1 beta-3-deoxy-D-manno-oct-2-ulosonic acid transferase [Acinetobacter sp. ANC 4558]